MRGHVAAVWVWGGAALADNTCGRGGGARRNGGGTVTALGAHKAVLQPAGHTCHAMGGAKAPAWRGAAPCVQSHQRPPSLVNADRLIASTLTSS